MKQWIFPPSSACEQPETIRRPSSVGEFVLKLLKKRLFSSPAAFEVTLGKHIASLGGRKSVAWQREVADGWTSSGFGLFCLLIRTAKG
jgi:hypothetical protein